MNKYRIDYGYGVADFYCDGEGDVIKQFYTCADACFGIRKSMISDPVVVGIYQDILLPLPYRTHSITHLLVHSGDEIAFDANHKQDGLHYWKIKDEWGDWCECETRGIYSADCEVHKYYYLKETT